MSLPSDDQMDHFRVESDRAFLAMQVSADKEMQKFLASYSDGATMTSFQTPDMTWSVAAPTVARPTFAAAKRKVKETINKVAKLASDHPPKLPGKAGHAAHQAFNDFGELGDSVKQSLNITGQEALNETRGVLANASMDLGERAKREATALRDAARKAMTEERSLSGLKQRAQQELLAAKQRIQTELLDAQADARQDLEGVAINNLGKLQEQGFQAAGSAGQQAQLELDQLLGGGQPKR